MASVAIVVVESSAFGLLRIEAEFGIRLAALDIAAGYRQKRENHHTDTEAQKNTVREAHDGRGIAIKDADVG